MMGCLIHFQKPPLRCWHVHPVEPGSPWWTASFLGMPGDFEPSPPEVRPTSRYEAAREARNHPQHFGLPVIVQADHGHANNGGRAA